MVPKVHGCVNEFGRRKYNNLFTLVKSLLIISHGNAEAERGFSINKHLLAVHGSATQEETIESIRMVKDYIKRCGGTDNVKITKQMVNDSKVAYRRYLDYLAEKKALEEKEKEAAKKSATAVAAVSADKKKEEAINTIDNDIQTLQCGIDIAEDTIKVGNEEQNVNMQEKTWDKKNSKIAG